MSRYLLNIFFLAAVSSGIGAQEDTSDVKYFAFQAHYGFIIPHSEAIEQVSHTNPFGFEIIRSRLHTSAASRQIFNACWSSGIEARYFNYQNPDVLGGVYDITAFVEPVIIFSHNFFITLRGGMGLSYHSKIYDPENNPLNQFFSSRISFPLYVDARFKYRIGDRTCLTASLCYNHISNGGYRQPNKGMNFPTAAIGFERYKMPFRIISSGADEAKGPYTRKPFIKVQGLGTVKIIGADSIFTQKSCMVYGIHTGIVKPLGRMYRLGAGAEMIIDGYIKETLRRDRRSTDNKRLSVTFGQEFRFGKVTFGQALGTYIYAPYRARNQVYQKYELSYAITNDLSMGIFLKSHLHVAELMGLCFSTSLFNR